MIQDVTNKNMNMVGHAAYGQQFIVVVLDNPGDVFF